MSEVRFVDTTIRDGPQSLWAKNMRTGMMLPIAALLDRAGFEAIETIYEHPRKMVRELKEDPWERLRHRPAGGPAHALTKRQDKRFIHVQKDGLSVTLARQGSEGGSSVRQRQ